MLKMTGFQVFWPNCSTIFLISHMKRYNHMQNDITESIIFFKQLTPLHPSTYGYNASCAKLEKLLSSLAREYLKTCHFEHFLAIFLARFSHLWKNKIYKNLAPSFHPSHDEKSLCLTLEKSLEWFSGKVEDRRMDRQGTDRRI